MRAIAWTYFALAQLVMLAAMLAGFVVLMLPCLLHAWELSPVPSINDGRRIDRWTWALLNPIWGNPEDGVSGLAARVWVNGVTQRAYWPSCPSAALRAYAWSAWRNSCDALKYSLAITCFGTPSVVIAGRRIGWSVENGRPVLVI
ncbi:MAG: hypothetical protein KGI82_01030 [Betaproteobacteria bacterium]|nr:hypothetical protein [Betaproteobacteria bacterium]